MKLSALAFAVPLALAAVSGPAGAEDLLQVYREAQRSDPALAAARANWTATQERVPQARSGLLPNVGATGTANASDGRAQRRAAAVPRGAAERRRLRFRALAAAGHAGARAAGALGAAA